MSGSRFLGTWLASAALVLATTCGALAQVGATSTATPDREVEPNDKVGQATPMREGHAMRGGRSHKIDIDYFSIDIPTPGPRHLTVRRFPAGKKPFELKVDVMPGGGGKPLYTYSCRPTVAEHSFYPVFAKGPHELCVTLGSDSGEGDEYELLLEPFEGPVSAADVAAAQAAIDRGVARLLASTPTANVKTEKFPLAVEAIALSALCEGRGARERAPALERDWVGWLETRVSKSPDGSWRGAPLSGFSTEIYQQAIVTLALADDAAAGSERARKLCRPAAEYLLAAQLSPARPEAWKGPITTANRFYGGWRYAPKSTDADISATGWCLVALMALDAAGVEVPGALDAAGLGVEFVQHCLDATGFHYEPSTRDPSNIDDAIGALIGFLSGEEGPALSAAGRIDRHLPAVTQVDQGEEYPLYYAYYATRALYMRGGDGWETWRAATIRQLVRVQGADGSWPALEKDVTAGPRFATALGVIILRTCLNEPPRYLKREVRGF